MKLPMAERSFSRRELLSGFLRRSDADAAREPGTAAGGSDLVARYQELLRLRGDLLPWGLADSEMPAPAGAIREAIVAAVSADLSPAARDRLRHAYASLPWFRPAEEIEVLRAGKAALERQDASEEGRAAIVRAFEIRNRILAEVARLAREFDGAVRRIQ
ncbi:MAG: hypothetical protein ACREQY_09160, partial [Candidatus Binatia bacterium]